MKQPIEELKWLARKIDECNSIIGSEAPDHVRLERQEDLRIMRSITSLLNPVETAFKFKCYTQFIDCYHQWYISKVGVKPRIDAGSGKAMKQIIAYLVEASTDKSEDGALKGWEYVLRQWDRLSPFIAQQKGLMQINKNLNEILDQLRNGHAKTNSAKNSREELERKIRHFDSAQ